MTYKFCRLMGFATFIKDDERMLVIQLSSEMR